MFWNALGRIVKIPDSKLRVVLPQIMQSVSVSVTERLGLKGSSLFAALHSVHSYRFLINILIKTGKDFKSFKDSGFKKREFIKYRHLVMGLITLLTAW